MATRIAEGLAGAGITPLAPVDANELFVALAPALAEALRTHGFSFHDWPPLGAGARRFVTAFDTREADVDALVHAVRAQLG
jgi:threonine aldolase